MHLRRSELIARQQCAAGTSYYVCSANGFIGCCETDPCALPGCPNTGTAAVTTAVPRLPSVTTVTKATTITPQVQTPSIQVEVPGTATAGVTAVDPTDSSPTSATGIVGSTSDATGISAGNSDQITNPHTRSPTLIVGVVLGGIILALLLGAAIYCLHRRSRNRKDENRLSTTDTLVAVASKELKPPRTPPPLPPSSPQHLDSTPIQQQCAELPSPLSLSAFPFIQPNPSVIISELPHDPVNNHHHHQQQSEPLLSKTSTPSSLTSKSRQLPNNISPLSRLTSAANQLHLDTSISQPAKHDPFTSPTSASRRHILSWSTYEGGPRREESIRRNGRMSATLSPESGSGRWSGGI